MIKLFRRLFGYRETVIIKKTLEVERGYRKAYGISWKTVFLNFRELLKNWPRKAKYRKFYYIKEGKPDNVLGYIDLGNVKTAVEAPRQIGFYLAGQIDPNLVKDRNKS